MSPNKNSLGTSFFFSKKEALFTVEEYLGHIPALTLVSGGMNIIICISSVGEQKACSEFSWWKMDGIGRMDLSEFEFVAFIIIEQRNLYLTLELDNSWKVCFTNYTSDGELVIFNKRKFLHE